ncbi:MAG: LOG family protein [Hormoscilla sp.]
MVKSSSNSQELASLQEDVAQLINQLPYLQHGKWIQQALVTLVQMAGSEIDRLDWKILTASMQDLERGFQIFYPYRHVRKITMFGSARLPSDSPEYQIAIDFARRVTQQGFMVMTGAGGGIMEAGNVGAGPEKSFGLNIQMPFEQNANPFIAGDKLIDFKYFFTRKLFFLRESDALALFPGGLGTQDETFESLTLCQTGKYGPVPLVLIDKPGGDYWLHWDAYVREHLLRRGLISPEDLSLYKITDKLDVACETISHFYRVFHSSRYVKEKLVIRLKEELKDADIEQLNVEFGDILVSGTIEKSKALPAESQDDTFELPRLVLHFNQRNFGRLYQMIAKINQMGTVRTALDHPEQK